jgi:hypothetical protein
MRAQRDSGGIGTSTIILAQAFETVNSIPYAGKTVTLSFYARKGANYSAASDALNVVLQSGTGTDQGAINNFTGFIDAISQNVTITSTWQRFTITTASALSSSLTQLRVVLSYTPVGTAGAADYFEATGVQIDIGSVALPFRRAISTIQGELAACQRYYYRFTPLVGTRREGVGHCISTTVAQINFPYPVTMRTAPTALEQSGTAGDYSVATISNIDCSSVPVVASITQASGTVSFTVASGLVAGDACLYRNVNTNGFLGWSAEL